jgi:hypothetical protein
LLEHGEALLRDNHDGGVTYEDWTRTLGVVQSPGLLSVQQFTRALKFFVYGFVPLDLNGDEYPCEIDDAKVVSLLAGEGFKMNAEQSLVFGFIQLPRPAKPEEKYGGLMEKYDENDAQWYRLRVSGKVNASGWMGKVRVKRSNYHYLHPIHQIMDPIMYERRQMAKRQRMAKR